MIPDMFDLAIEIILGAEGIHNPNDEGSDTWYGLRRANHPNETPWPPTRERVIQIARAEYWDPYHFDQLPAALAIATADWIWNGGRAISTLQHVLGVTPDGSIGPETANAAARCNLRTTLVRYHMERDLYYIGLHGFDNNGRGWLARNADLLLSLAPLV